MEVEGEAEEEEEEAEQIIQSIFGAEKKRIEASEEAKKKKVMKRTD